MALTHDQLDQMIWETYLPTVRRLFEDYTNRPVVVPDSRNLPLFVQRRRAWDCCLLTSFAVIDEAF